jgi:serine/threonine-protein kinase
MILGVDGMKDKRTQPATPARSPELPDPEPDLTGRTLGDFRVLRRLGRGGMGQVYLAEQISLKRKVALKMLRAELAADTVSLQRFRREAEAVARVTHANIVQVYAISETDGLHYMALEYVEGRNLREYLEKKGPPELLVTLSIMRQVAAALQRAHELGIIHRDIKPENILLTRRGEAKVADFGLSRCFADDSQPLNLTRTGVSMGTPLYMSPEQVACKPVDHRSDIYSFGVTCYHMLAGQPPFRGESPFEVAIKHVQSEPPRLADIRPDIPAELCALVHRLMAKKPEERLQTSREVVKELVRLRDNVVGVGSTNPVLAVGPGPPLPGDTAQTQVIPPSPAKRRRLWLAAASVVLALVSGLVVGKLSQRPAAPSYTPAPTEPSPSPFDTKARENELKKLVEDSARPQDKLQTMAGLRHAIELGLLYVSERRLDEADRFFKDLEKRAPKVYAYRIWGELGEAIVLAFRDKPAQSNKQFLKALDKGEKAGRFWIHTPAVRQIIAEALNHNHENAPGMFPPRLEPFRHPPSPKQKNGG